MISAASHSTIGSLGNSYQVLTQIVRQNRRVRSVTLVTYDENLSWRDAVAGGDASLSLRIKGLRQDSGRRILSRLPRREVSEANLHEITRNLGEGRLLGVCSSVALEDGQVAHIPMMDFICGPSSKNITTLVGFMTDLGQGPGCLLFSGNSYHYYGFRLLNGEEWKVFMGKCLLMCGFADDRYIGHQLIDGHCVLRLSAGKLKASIPNVIAEFS